jgi:hypothetical protein
MYIHRLNAVSLVLVAVWMVESTLVLVTAETENPTSENWSFGGQEATEMSIQCLGV